MDGGILALGNNSGLSSGIHPPLFLPTERGPFCVGETEGYSMMKVGDRTPIKVLKSDAEMHSALKQGWKCFFLIEKPEASTGQQNNKKRNRRNRRGQRKKVNPSGEPGAAGSTGDAVSTEQAVQPLGADFPKLRGPRVKRQVDDEVTTERSSQTSEAERPMTTERSWQTSQAERPEPNILVFKGLVLPGVDGTGVTAKELMADGDFGYLQTTVNGEVGKFVCSSNRCQTQSARSWCSKAEPPRLMPLGFATSAWCFRMNDDCTGTLMVAEQQECEALECDENCKKFNEAECINRDPPDSQPGAAGSTGEPPVSQPGAAGLTVPEDGQVVFLPPIKLVKNATGLASETSALAYAQAALCAEQADTALCVAGECGTHRGTGGVEVTKTAEGECVGLHESCIAETITNALKPSSLVIVTPGRKQTSDAFTLVCSTSFDVLKEAVQESCPGGSITNSGLLEYCLHLDSCEWLTCYPTGTCNCNPKALVLGQNSLVYKKINDKNLACGTAQAVACLQKDRACENDKVIKNPSGQLEDEICLVMCRECTAAHLQATADAPGQVTAIQLCQECAEQFPKGTCEVRSGKMIVCSEWQDSTDTAPSAKTTPSADTAAAVVPGPGGYMTWATDRLKTKLGEYSDIVVACAGAVATVCLTVGCAIRGHLLAKRVTEENRRVVAKEDLQVIYINTLNRFIGMKTANEADAVFKRRNEQDYQLGTTLADLPQAATVKGTQAADMVGTLLKEKQKGENKSGMESKATEGAE
eukprot:GHVQ01001220.1.p1 GENE.GHVQ01001220.1~~GHVQ01001220.1.p1  ORF type:complete len:757 (+),score=92.35 GHVQ01001220.1:607-2877(+)